MCSRSRLVTTARMGESLRKERSLSSASATRYWCAEAGVGAEGVDAAADDDGGVEAAGGEDAGDHGGGGGFAVHAGDGDAVFEAHELGEHFGALDDGDFAGAGFEDFRITSAETAELVTTTCAVADVGGVVALVDGRAELGEAVGDGAAAQVGAGDLHAQGEEDFGDAAHADAADGWPMKCGARASLQRSEMQGADFE
jgi:hypothetical protein